MKKYIALAILLMATTVYGVIELTLSVPDQHVARVIEMMTALADTHIHIHVQGSRDPSDPNAPDYSGSWDYRIAPKDPNETNKQFGERFVNETMRAMVRLHEFKLDSDRASAEHAAIDPADVNVPDEIIQ